MKKDSYQIMPRNYLFEACLSMVENEIKPGHTVTFTYEVDLRRIHQVRSQPNQVRPTYTAFIAKAVALALKEFPYSNQRVISRPFFAWWAPRLQRFLNCDIAVAIERKIPGAEGVAFVDVLRNVDSLAIDEVTESLQKFSLADESNNENWKSFSKVAKFAPRFFGNFLLGLPKYLPSLWVKYRGAAVLISSPGKYGPESILGSWAWPVGFSFGRVKERLQLNENAQVQSIPIFTFSFNFDRRVMAGAAAAHFFKCVVDHLENPKEISAMDSLRSQNEINANIT